MKEGLQIVSQFSQTFGVVVDHTKNAVADVTCKPASSASRVVVVNRQPLELPSADCSFGFPASSAQTFLVFFKRVVFRCAETIHALQPAGSFPSFIPRRQLRIAFFECLLFAVAFFLAGAILFAGTFGAMSIGVSARNSVSMALTTFFAFWFWVRNVCLVKPLPLSGIKLFLVLNAIVVMPFGRALFTSSISLFAHLRNKVFAASTVVRIGSIFAGAKARNYFARSIVRLWMGFKPFLVAAEAAAFSSNSNFGQYVFFVPAQLGVSSNSSFPHVSSVAANTVFVNNTLLLAIDTLSYLLVALAQVVDSFRLTSRVVITC